MGVKQKILHHTYYKYFPREWVEKVYLLRRLNVYEEKKILFIHVPKSGGTSVAMAVYGKHVAHIKAVDFKRMYPERFGEYFKFAVVRNPYDRLYSAYKFIINGGTSIVPVQGRRIYKAMFFLRLRDS